MIKLQLREKRKRPQLFHFSINLFKNGNIHRRKKILMSSAESQINEKCWCVNCESTIKGRLNQNLCYFSSIHVGWSEKFSTRDTSQFFF